MVESLSTCLSLGILVLADSSVAVAGKALFRCHH